MIENTELLDQIIVGYVPHRIYAFSTPQSVDYLKIGETSRGVPVRLKEWQSKIADLKHEKDWLAMLPKDTVKQKEFFRDFALHKYFKDNAFDFLLPEDAPGNSKEFYKVYNSLQKDLPKDIKLNIAIDSTIFVKKSVVEVAEITGALTLPEKAAPSSRA